MPCDGPLTAYKPAAGSSDRRLVFDKRKAHSGIAVQVPCGQCSGCRLESSRQWAVRCMHELRSHPGAGSAFLTLTYRDKDLPADRSLKLDDYQNFLKRLRHVSGAGLRFFGCGEYGETTSRPHYHIITFNYRPDDLKLYTRGEDYNLYTSSKVDDIWGLGDVKIGDVSFESCAYVARYCMKKIKGPAAADHYNGRLPEFLTQSRSPGLGFHYYQKYKAEILAHDSIVINGHEVKPPRYYDNLTVQSDANMRQKLQLTVMENIKRKRRKLAFTPAARADNTSRRRYVKSLVREAKLKLKARIL